MIIQKILNNNVVITLDEKQSEIIVMGKGLAYNKRKGDEIDESKITKRFVLDSLPYHERLVDAFSSISGICVEICDDIVRYAEQRLSQKLDDSIYISLLDHISTSIERYKDGIVLKNKLLWEIKNFYKNEYDIGLYGLSVIKEKCAVSMQEDEAGFIALHVVSAEISNNIQNIYEITGFIQSILHIVKYHFKFDFDTSSLNYNRFITHLKFFGHRVFSKKVNEKEQIKNNILDIIKEKYTNPYLCALKIKQFIEEKYNYYLDDDEILYLTIHIANLLTKDMNKSDNT